MRSLSLLAVALALVGCSSTEEPLAVEPDAGATAPTSADAAVPRTCLISDSYGDLGSQSGTVAIRPAEEDMPEGPRVVVLEVPLDQAAAPDVLVVELWEGSIGFTDGIEPGSFQLAGTNSDLINCGACVYIAADRVAGEVPVRHVASAGTLTLDEVDLRPGGRIVGRLTDVTLREVELKQGGQGEVENGCTSSVSNVALSFTVAAAAP